MLDAKAEWDMPVIFTGFGVISVGGRSQIDPDVVYLWDILHSGELTKRPLLWVGKGLLGQ